MTFEDATALEAMPRRCEVCAKEIPAGASICSECGYFQKPWRNELKYWSGITGLVTVIATAIVFTWTASLELYAKLFKPDMAISEIDTHGRSAVWNLTRSDLWITTLRFRSERPRYDLQWSVYKVVEANKQLQFEILGLTKVNWHGDVSWMYSAAASDNFAPDLADDEWQAILRNELSDKYVVNFMYSNGAQFLQLNQYFGNRLRNVSCTGELNYLTSADGSSKMQSFPCVGIVRRLKPKP